MDQVITFDKSLQQRLQEYKDVLTGYEVLSVSQIQKEWSYFTELSMDPNGWQAVWKIPRLKCEDLKISFPTVVLVYVEDVDSKTLSALIKILAVQDDIEIPEKHYVPLIQLWPTKEQDSTIGLTLETTANSLDMLRFFYQNIFMPWDYEEEDTSDWLSKHLESRLRLYYDMRNGVIPRNTAMRLGSLISEARRLQARREKIETDLEYDEQETDVDTINSSNKPTNEKVQTLVDLHVRILQIGTEVQLLEDPLTRDAVIRQQQELIPITNNELTEVWLVAKEGNIDEYIAFLNKVKESYPKNIVTFVSDLSPTLEIMKPNDTVILSKGKHKFKEIGGLENGGLLKGLYEAQETLVISTNEQIMMDFSGENVILENLTIDATFSQCGVLVRKGKVTLKNCKLIGDGESSIHQGIIVFGGSELEMVNCEMTRFCTAIVGNSGSKITLRNCEIFNVNYGIKIYDKCNIKAENSCLYNCDEYGLCIETENCLEDEYQKIGNFDVLKIVPDISLDGVSGKNNAKGNVIISQKPKLEPMRDLFSTTLENVMCRNSTSDEEMEVNIEDLNNTVIEKSKDGHLTPVTI